MKIGILNGGGDCPGLNAVTRGVVKAAHNKYNDTILGIRDSFEGLLGDREDVSELTPLSIRGILHQGGTILYSSNQGDPFRFPTEVNGKKEFRDVSDDVMRKIEKLGIECLICVGGDGTLSIARKFRDKGLNVIGVPKTIDNDLNATDSTFGFQTAVNTATDAIDKLHTTAASHHRVIVVEVMGRYAGWIALESGIAGGADIILLPEIPFHIDVVCDIVKKRRSSGRGFSLVVVAEGAKMEGGELSVVGKNKLGYEILGGMGHEVARHISEKTGIDVRATILGHIQRGGSPSPFDRILASRCGIRAVDLAHEGKFGTMVCLKGTEVVHSRLDDALDNMKFVDPQGSLVRDAEALGISLGR